MQQGDRVQYRWSWRGERRADWKGTVFNTGEGQFGAPIATVDWDNGTVSHLYQSDIETIPIVTTANLAKT